MEKYLGNNRFIVCIGGKRLSFAKVSNLVHSVEYESIPIGGINDSVYIAQNPTRQPQTITFERAVQKTNDIIQKLKPGVHLGKQVEIMILNMEKKSSKIEHSYYITDGVVTKCEISSLDAMGNEILIQKLEITHTGIYQDY